MHGHGLFARLTARGRYSQQNRAATTRRERERRSRFAL
jgi:hypothetical protein